MHADDRRRRTREEYAEGLPGYHDPTAGFDGSTTGRSALTLRALLAAFGLVVCVVGAVLTARTPVAWFAWVLGVIAVVALVDPVWVLYRKWRGEPG